MTREKDRTGQKLEHVLSAVTHLLNVIVRMKQDLTTYQMNELSIAIEEVRAAKGLK